MVLRAKPPDQANEVSKAFSVSHPSPLPHPNRSTPSKYLEYLYFLLYINLRI
jgi:hypothetical protein